MNIPIAPTCPDLAAGHFSPVPLSAKILYGVGEIPITVLMVLFGLFTLFFYTSVMGLRPSLAGIGISCSLVLDALLDPYIGYLSDRWHGALSARLGRRHAFMLPGVLAMGPCFFLLFSPPRSLGNTGLFLWLLVCCIFLRVASAIYRIPYLSLGAELSRDYDDRTSTMAVRAMFGLLGTLLAAGLSFLLFFPATPDGSEPKLRYVAYPRLGITFGAVIVVAGLISFAGTLRHRTFGGDDALSPTARSFFRGFWTSMHNRAFRSIWCSVTLFFLAVVLNASFAIHYFTWYAGIHGGRTLSSVESCFYVGALLGTFFWLRLARRTEKQTLYMISGLASAVLLCGAALLIGPGRLFGTGNVLPLLLGHAIGGLFASAVWVIPSSMMADVTDHDELSTGFRREGIYFGIMNFGEKIAAGGALLLAGVLLSLFGRQSVKMPSQPPASAPYLGLLYGGIPAIILVLALLLILPYRLTRSAVHEIQGQLAARRALKHP